MISVRYQKTYLKHKLKIGILLYTKGIIQRTAHICFNLDKMRIGRTINRLIGSLHQFSAKTE